MRQLPSIARLPGLRQIPLRQGRRQDIVLFQSFDGRFSDNPRAVYEELLARESSLSFVWVLRPGEPEAVLGSHTRVVRVGELDHLKALGSCRYLVTNVEMPRYYRKRRGVTYLQTWHGTPLKRIGLDVPAPSARVSGRYLASIPNEARQWDYLLSSNPHTSAVFPAAFAYAGPLLEVGSPRNDVLSRADAAERSRVRATLGLASPGPTAVLFAPTFRDDEREVGLHSLGVDLARLAADCPDHVLLLRLHPLVRDALDGVPLPGNVVDVSAIADIRELFLAADALVTDYSSVMFDFAITGRPIIIYAPDLEHYRNVLERLLPRP